MWLVFVVLAQLIVQWHTSLVYPIVYSKYMQNLTPARLFSASVLGSRPGSVAVRVSGCPGAAWVWCNRHRTAPASLALRVPRNTPNPLGVAQCSARTLSQRFGLRVSVRRAPCGAYWFECSGPRAAQLAAARWWSGILAQVARAQVQA